MAKEILFDEVVQTLPQIDDFLRRFCPPGRLPKNAVVLVKEFGSDAVVSTIDLGGCNGATIQQLVCFLLKHHFKRELFRIIVEREPSSLNGRDNYG